MGNNKYVVVYMRGIYRRFEPVWARNKDEAKNEFYKRIDDCIILEINEIKI